MYLTALSFHLQPSSLPRLAIGAPKAFPLPLESLPLFCLPLGLCQNANESGRRLGFSKLFSSLVLTGWSLLPPHTALLLADPETERLTWLGWQCVQHHFALVHESHDHIHRETRPQESPRLLLSLFFSHTHVFTCCHDRSPKLRGLL